MVQPPPPPSRPLNPLLFDDILDHVFGYCEWNDLKACRQTCKLWYKRSEKQWKIKAPMKELYQPSPYGKSRHVLHGTGSSAKATSSRCVAEYQKFRLQHLIFKNDWKTCYVFWTDRGQFITEIELVDCCIRSGSACRGLLYGESTPALRTLKLENVSYACQRNGRELPDKSVPNRRESMQKLVIIDGQKQYPLPVSWTSVFECFPNLEILMLRKKVDLNEELARVLGGIVNYVNRHNNRHTIKCLTTMDLGLNNLYDFPTALLNHFRLEVQENPTRCIALETLVFGLGLYPNCKNICELLSYQRNTLKVVKLYNKCYGFWNGLRPFKNFQLPQMLTLTRLDLDDCPIISFRFLIGCPVLKTLNWTICNEKLRQLEKWNAIRDETEWTVAEKKELILPFLTSFHCNVLMNWNNDDMILLGRWIPNVTSLAIHSSDLSFEGLCSSFPNLTRLFLDEAEISDIVFTGIDISAQQFAQIDLSTYQRRPNITNLNKLEEIVIGRNPNQKILDGWLSEFAARQGLLRLPSLRKVTVPEIVLTRLGKQALEENSLLSIDAWPWIRTFIQRVQ